MIAQRTGNIASLPTRIIAVLLFGLNALAISQGDAIRWYPLFTLEVALFAGLYLAGGNSVSRLMSAVPLGLAVSTNYLAAIVILPFVIYRYGLQRQFRASFDLAYWVLAAGFSGVGIYSAYSLLAHHPRLVESQFAFSIIQAMASDVLGFFGGHALGLGQAWIVLPTVIIASVAAISQISYRSPAEPVHLLLLLLAGAVLMAFATFGKPRSFLYLAPVMAAVLTLYFDRQSVRRHTGVFVGLIALELLPAVVAIANIGSGTHPFKRNSVIPYQSVIDFIEANEKGKVLVLSTDPVLPWVLRHTPDHGDRCISFFLDGRTCLETDVRFDSIFVVSGHSDKSDTAVMARFLTAVANLSAGRQKVVTIHAGLDDDAALKTRLTGVRLDKNILTVDLYR
jgi:hypothetical protein